VASRTRGHGQPGKVAGIRGMGLALLLR
jgi:hypothetical protein